MSILIVGAGPCGLACGRELDRLGHRDWLILERHDHAGGGGLVDRRSGD